MMSFYFFDKSLLFRRHHHHQNPKIKVKMYITLVVCFLIKKKQIFKKRAKSKFDCQFQVSAPHCILCVEKWFYFSDLQGF